MSYNDYKDKVIEHLGKYMAKLGIEEKGLFKYKGKDIPEVHILPLETGKKDAKKHAVETYNLLECVKRYPFLIAKDLHRYAHHLNSSQLMCYNFFRPFMEGEMKQNLIRILQDKAVVIDKSKQVVCNFEYVDDKDEGTNFDFYLKSGKTEVFFEIKYTEYGFGTFDKKDEGNRHKEKYKRIYIERIKKCPAIKKEIKFDENFRKNYQLIRNVIRVTDLQKYSVFVYDERNEKVMNQFNSFKEEYISQEYKGNVIGVTWQELVEKLDTQHRKEFKEKYIDIE